jgi:hypothetical protein
MQLVVVGSAIGSGYLLAARPMACSVEIMTVKSGVGDAATVRA